MKPDEAPQSTTRVRLNGGLGGRAVYGCRHANEAKNPKRLTRLKPYGRPGLAAMQNRPFDKLRTGLRHAHATTADRNKAPNR